MVKHNKVNKKKKNEEKKKGKKNTRLSMCICMCLFFLHRIERICVAAIQTTIDFWDTKVYDEQRKGKRACAYNVRNNIE
jgi:hypothetical protein